MKKMLMLCLASVLSVCFPLLAEAKEVTAKLPDYSITINGQAIDNQYEQHPFLMYRNITYFPLTEENKQFVGLKSAVHERTWRDPAHTVVYIGRDERSSDQWVSEHREEPNPRSLTVTLLNNRMVGDHYFYVALNTFTGEFQFGDEMAYPLITYGNTLYLPLTWQIVVEDLGWQYAYTKKEGLIIDSTDPLRPIFNDEVIVRQSPSLAMIEAMRYIYLPDGYIGYRPSTVGVPDMTIVYKKAGQPIKRVDVRQQLAALMKEEYNLNMQRREGKLEEGEVQPYVEDNIIHILCATMHETFMLQINLDTGEVLSVEPYTIVGQ